MSILIKNAYIVTQNKKREYITQGFIIVKKDRIYKIESGNPNLSDLKEIDKTIDAEGFMILPGFINTHVHLGESIFQGLFKKKYSLEDYLNITNEITKKTKLIEENRNIIADYSILNLLYSGTSTICGGRVVDSANQWGIRNVSGYMIMNSAKLRTLSFDLEKKYKKEYKKIKNTKISYSAIFMHSINMIDLRTLSIVKKILKEFSNTKLILHVAETKIQEQEIRKKFGLSSVSFLKNKGLLNKNTILIHCNWINDSDFALIKKHKSSVVQCLSSNINVADRVLNLTKVLKNSINVCLATDGLPTSSTFSVLEEAKKCLFYYHKSKKRITEQKCLDLITIDAANTLGLENSIGSIEKNKKADIIFLKMDHVDIKYLFKNSSSVSGMIIDGVIKMWNGKILDINEDEIVKKFNKLSGKIKKYYEYFPNKR
jgi:5-methylthioadenosine/S-adenosylhomocysteine deaminase